MKTERFEDKIQKKLESIEPDFQENDWENFQNYSSTKLAINKNAINSSIFKIAASIALIGTLFLGVSQYFTNNNLANQVEKLVLQNEQLKSKQVELEKTIFENKKAEISKRYSASENLLLSNKELFEKGINPNKIENIIGNNKEKLNTNLKENSKENSKENLSEYSKIFAKNKSNNVLRNVNRNIATENKTIEEKISIYSEKNNTNKQKEMSNKYSNSTEIYSQNKVQSSIDGTISQNAIDNNGNINFTESGNITNYNKLILIELRSRGIVIDSSRKFTKMLNESDFAYYKPVATPKKKMYFTLADAHMRTGLSTNFGKGLFGYGIHSELFFDERISLKVGAKKMALQGENFTTELQFKNATKRDFREKYNVKIPPTKAILNIKEEFDLFVLPVNLSYYHPIQNGIHIVTAIGSEIDISGSKNIEYRFSKAPFFVPNNGGPHSNNANGEELDLNRFNQKTERKLFNNINIAIGAEKRFGKLGFQGKISDQFLVKNVDYRKKNSVNLEFGLNYRL